MYALLDCQVLCNYSLFEQITAPPELTVLMSAKRVGVPVVTPAGLKLHKFEQPVPIPVYLVAIVVGDLESRKLGPRSHVWSEKQYVEKAAYEFAEVLGYSNCSMYATIMTHQNYPNTEM
jgi:leukotriene-A4 hydrolase